MTRRISSIEVKNNAVYVNGRKARDTKGLIEDIKPTEIIIPEGPNAGKPYSGDAYEGTAGGYKFVFLIQNDKVFFQWDHVGTDGWIYYYKIGKEWVAFNTLSDVFFEMADWRSRTEKDFVPEWADSFDKLFKRFEKTYDTIINHQNRYGYGWGKRSCSKRDALWNRMNLILELFQEKYEVETYKFRKEKWDFSLDLQDYLG